jgi:hypothetical protein
LEKGQKIMSHSHSPIDSNLNDITYVIRGAVFEVNRVLKAFRNVS